MTHGYVVALDPPRTSPPRRWRCNHCGEEGTLSDLLRVQCPKARPASDAEVIEAVRGEK